MITQNIAITINMRDDAQKMNTDASSTYEFRHGRFILDLLTSRQSTPNKMEINSIINLTFKWNKRHYCDAMPHSSWEQPTQRTYAKRTFIVSIQNKAIIGMTSFADCAFSSVSSSICFDVNFRGYMMVQ